MIPLRPRGAYCPHMREPNTHTRQARSGHEKNATLSRALASLQVLIDSMGRQADLGPLLTRLLDVACDLIGADHGAIGLIDPAREVVRTAAVRNMPPNELGSETPAGV